MASDKDLEKQKKHASTKETIGRAQEKLGAAIGSDSLKGRGKENQAEGAATKASARHQQKSEGKKEKVKGAVEKAAGKLLGDERMKQSGDAKEIRGMNKERRGQS